MARPLSPYRRILEECEVISVSTAMGNLALYGITFEYTRGGRGGRRRWLCCPRCGRRMFKLYRPPSSPFFACRECHNVTYRCVQEHDARLDWLVKAPDCFLMYYMKHGEGPWRVLACRAAYAKLGVMGKHQMSHSPKIETNSVC